MKKIRIDEIISTWQTVEITFPDDVDIHNKEEIAELLRLGKFTNIEIIGIFPEIENHIDYDLDTIEVIEE
jgi:hypothetical protein